MGEVMYQTASMGMTLATTTGRLLAIATVWAKQFGDRGGGGGESLNIRTTSRQPYWGVDLHITRYGDHGEEAKDEDGGDLQGTEEQNPQSAGMVDNESRNWF